MKDDNVQEFKNKELAFQSFDEFCNMIDVPTPMNSNFIDNLEYALLYLSVGTQGSPIKHSELGLDDFPIKTFDGAWLVNVDRIGDEKLKFLNPFHEELTFELFQSFNMRTMTFGKKGEDTAPVNLSKFRLIEDKDRRHIPLTKWRRIMEYRMSYFTNKEKWFTHGEWYGINNLNKGDSLSFYLPIPVAVKDGYQRDYSNLGTYIKSDEYMDWLRNFHGALTMRLTQYYEWFVYIRETEKSVGIKIPILPESSKEVFALRDLPEGEVRKKAICNFVRQHYRTIKIEYNEQEREVLVKQHLRGETKFNWRGLQVNIIPAEYDINRIKPKKKFLQI